MKSILIDATHLGTDRPSGVEHYVDSLLPALVPQLISLGIQPTLVSHGHMSKDFFPKAAHYLTDHHIPGWGLTRVPWLLQTRRFDAYFTPSGIAPLIAVKPQAMTVHDISVYQAPETYSLPDRLRMSYLMRQSARACDQIIVPTHYVADEMARLWHVPVKKMTAIHHAVPLDYGAGSPDLDLNEKQHVQGQLPEYIKAGSTYFLCIGRIVTKKNIIPLLQGYAQYLAEYPAEEVPALVLVGSPGYGYAQIQQVLQQLQTESHRAAEKIVMRSFVSDSEKQILLRHAAAVVVPGPYEGFGLPALEALALGVPVIGSDAGGVAEVIAGHGTTVSSDSPDAWHTVFRERHQGINQVDSVVSKSVVAAIKARTWDVVASETARVLAKLV
jgi:glycosyltransferase involved in cell wall biosynthesis